MEHIEISSSGIKCDNPACDWTDTSVPVEQYKDWVNRLCPKCGDNLLTERDLANAMLAVAAAQMINDLSPEELEEMAKRMTPEALAAFQGIEGADLLKADAGDIIMTVDTHEQIKITGFRKAEEE